MIRSGAGLYYSENGTAGIESNRFKPGGPVNLGDFVNANQLADGYEQSVTTVSAGFPLYEIDLETDPTEYAGPASHLVPKFKKTINVGQWFLDIQHQLPWDILMTVGYNGTTAHNLPWWVRDFSVGPGTSTLSAYHPARRRVQGPAETNTLNQMLAWEIAGDNMLNSNYNAFTFKTEKRFSEGFSFTSSFTWSKGLDYSVSSLNERTEGFFGGATPLSPYSKDLWRNRGPGGLSRDFAYNLSVIYELPAGPGKGRFESGPASWVLGGWQLGTILSLQSGPWGTHRDSESPELGRRLSGYSDRRAQSSRVRT